MKLRFPLRGGRKRGAISLEMLGVLVMFGIFLGYAAIQGDETRKTGYATALAQHLNAASKGSQNFLDANTTLLREKLETANWLVVTQTDIRDNNGTAVTIPGDANDGLRRYLPVNMRTTRYGQQVRLYVYKGDSGSIHGLLSTAGGHPAGTAKQREDYMRIARQTAGMNGFGIRIANNVAGTAVNAIVGPNDSWRFLFSNPDYGNIPISEVPEGQLAKPMYAFSATAKDDFLYRVEVPGHPELNAMQTDLHMNGNTITDVGTITISQKPVIQGTTDYADVPPGGNGLVIEPYNTSGDVSTAAESVCKGVGGAANKKPDGFLFTVSTEVAGGQSQNDLNGLYMCMDNEARLISDSQNSTTTKGLTMKKHNETVRKPKCPKGTVPAIYVSQAAFAKGNVKPSPVTAVQVLAQDVDTTTWRVLIRVKTTKEADGVWADITTVPGATAYNFAVVHTACEREDTTL